jgi:hypothetical protein
MLKDTTFFDVSAYALLMHKPIELLEVAAVEKLGQAIFLTLMLALLVNISGYRAPEGMPTVNSASTFSTILRSPNLRL